MSLRWHYPNQVMGQDIYSLLSARFSGPPCFHMLGTFVRPCGYYSIPAILSLKLPRIFLYRHSSTAFLFPVRRISAIRIHCLLLFAITAVDFPDPVNLCKVFCTCTADPRKNGTRNIVPYTEDRARKCCKRIGCKISCCQ